MMKVYEIKDSKKSLIPAVTHVDGKLRLQTVDVKQNELYHMLINDFISL